MESVSVTYGGPYNAYVYKNQNVSANSPFWYSYIVPGIGFVKEVDHNTANAPKIQELIYRSKIKIQEEIIVNERKRYDPSIDGVVSLEEAIHALRVVSGVK